jgi:hypothetical protein
VYGLVPVPVATTAVREAVLPVTVDGVVGDIVTARTGFTANSRAFVIALAGGLRLSVTVAQ